MERVIAYLEEIPESKQTKEKQKEKRNRPSKDQESSDQLSLFNVS